MIWPAPRFRRHCVFLTALLFVTSGCGSSQPPAIPQSTPRELFEDATERLGIDFVHDCGNANDYSMIRIMGSGCAIFDADGDGKPDILLLQNAGPNSQSRNQLYRQAADGTFENVSQGSGLDIPGHNMGVAIGDWNADGRPDVLITQYRGVRLFENLGNCRFKDITAESGVRNPYWGASASFLDFDRDGWQDLVIVNYIDGDPKQICQDSAGNKDFCGPVHFPDSGSPTLLFRNAGVAGGMATRFVDVTQSSGLGRLKSPGLGVYCADFSGDHWPDIFVANDGHANHLWINQRDGTFKEEAALRGIAYTGSGKAAANMGVAAGDIDGDGLIDLFVTHLTSEMNTFWKQGPVGRFTDRTLAVSAVSTRWRGTGFGTAMTDLDLDGWPDLVLVNGRVHKGQDKAEGLPEFWRRYGERNQFLKNVEGKFADISSNNPAVCGQANIARGLAVGDLNGDGRPDLVINSIAGPAKVYLNQSSGNHWLAVRPRLANGRLAYGAHVQVKAGGRTQYRLIQPGESYLSSRNPEALFGLGNAEKYDEITIRWPDGTDERFAGGDADRSLTLTQAKPK